MNNLLTSDKIYIKQSQISNAGRGVYARVEIKKGEIIEICPIIEIGENDPSSSGEGILITYLYYFGETKQKALIALGFGAIYNHTYTPNAVYEIDEEQQTISFIAATDIEKDLEITVNYNQTSPEDTKPLWFDEAN